MKFIYYLIALLLVMAISIQAVYSYNAHKISMFLQPSNNIYSKEVSEILWTASGEKGDVSLESLSAISFVYELISDSASKTHARLKFTKGAKVASFAARALLFNHPDYHGHFYNAVSVIWISNNWTSEQVMATVLDNAYFGFGIKSFTEAAKVYFNKASRDLTLDEIVTLVTITHGASRFNPICSPERFSQRVERVQFWINMSGIEEYVDYQFKKPEIYKPVGAECRN